MREFRAASRGKSGSDPGFQARVAAWKIGFTIASIFTARPELASYDFVEPYLRTLFGFLGVAQTRFLTAGGTKALNQGADRDTFLAPHLQSVRTHAQAA